ncbi:MAG: type IV pilus biogenesis/stability protein PilW [Ectothiorhodospiraceae bacterium]|nr:type IV pilus biogenesis/stability protein PilW [Ectothiorhodospiraceae bacterium]MCH8506212.1 type IV pilus biogenesis/stability protein PilW [Ectothiorhodospiraceae bacterium]
MEMRRLLVLTFVFFLLSGCASNQQRGDMKQASMVNTQLGISYMQQGNLNQAMDSLRKAVEQDGSNAQAHSSIAVLYERLEEYEDAERHYRRAVRLDDGNPSAHNNYGRFLCNRGEYAAAEQQFQRALRDPLYERRELPLANAGFCALRAGDHDKAREYLRRALDRSPSFAPALRRMAELQFESEEYLSARGYMQRYREVGDMDAQALWLAVRIERALGNRDEASSYGLRLRADYPDSEEAREYLRLVDR